MTPPRGVEDAAPYRDGPKPPHTRAPSGRHPLTLPPPRRGRACPARNFPPPAVNLPPRTTPIICARQPPPPQYTPCPNFSLKLCRKNQKNLQKPVDKGHTTCYNNQAVSRAKPAAAAAGAFTYSLYAVFLRKLLQKTFRKPLDKRENLIYNIQAVTETRQRSRTLKIEQN